MWSKTCRAFYTGAISLIALSACVQPILLVGEKTKPIQADKVSIYYAQRPDCEYEIIGYLRINGGYYSQASLFRTMQWKAAEVGADGVFVHETRRLDILEYIGAASAIRCISSP